MLAVRGRRGGGGGDSEVPARLDGAPGAGERASKAKGRRRLLLVMLLLLLLLLRGEVVKRCDRGRGWRRS